MGTRGQAPLRRSQQPGTPEKQQLEHPGGAGPEVAVDWPQVEELRRLAWPQGALQARAWLWSCGIGFSDPAFFPQTLVILQLWAGLDVLLVDSWPELAQHVCAFTRALAQRPFKCVNLRVGG